MSWYFILFWVCFCFFILKTLISFFAGDTDIDFDADGDIDFDVSTLFSFKGVMHFLLGFSSFLSLVAKFSEAASLSWYHYLIAIGVGFIFMVGLFYLYKLMMKLNHGNSDEVNIDGCKCAILTNLGDGFYKVLIYTPAGILDRAIKSYEGQTDLKIGGEYKITKVDGKPYIFS